MDQTSQLRVVLDCGIYINDVRMIVEFLTGFFDFSSYLIFLESVPEYIFFCNKDDVTVRQ